ncbi:dipeptide epimerase [Salipaludibacillus aurantiacus]|uniref:Dipeptide epimerase n=1 Tax=Salipaludibacillus aurantiacus TaxID=1601833 RepID=A0A1H9SLI1_9BACI|nr:dipeptide epimerase [Salipaludibacillus aurantiacus]SER85223.1 o-succinylbenzoate synthase/o-succinylbenzoate synthase,TIGR01928 [Salipaludibacillus aurantiacus]
MVIEEIEKKRIAVPLKKPFKTALRTLETAEAIVVTVRCDNGLTGFGEAPPTVVITGESMESIESAIHYVFRPALTGMNVLNFESVFNTLHRATVGNTSAKAAVDMAVYDLLAKKMDVPLYQYLGGYRKEIETDYTVSVNSSEEMGEDAVQFVNDGFTVLKVKVGKNNIEKDVERICEIRRRVGSEIKIRLDANQGWNAKEAVRSIRKMEDMNLNIELIEQPVRASDLEGLKTVTDNTGTPIMADESVFSPADALEVINRRCADLINIKLMKTGGIYKAELINRLAEMAGMECMTGSMIETRLGISAAAHFAASKKNITRFDFDSPLMLKEDIIKGGMTYEKNKIILQNEPGLGITGAGVCEEMFE